MKCLVHHGKDISSLSITSGTGQSHLIQLSFFLLCYVFPIVVKIFLKSLSGPTEIFFPADARGRVHSNKLVTHSGCALHLTLLQLGYNPHMNVKLIFQDGQDFRQRASPPKCCFM